MTQPVRDAQQAVDDLAEELDGLVARELAAVTGPLAHQLSGLAPELTRLWVLHFGGIDPDPDQVHNPAGFLAAAELAVRAALALTPAPLAAFDRAVALAFGIGVASTGSATPPDALDRPLRPDLPVIDLRRPLDQQAAQAISALSVDVAQGRGYSAVTDAVARSRRGLRRVETALEFETTRAAADGVIAVARQSGVDLVWVAERDGCLSCLAYAGETASPSVGFRPGLTFGDRPVSSSGSLLVPPLHPHCRCGIQLHDSSDSAVAEALKREARRSVLRGWANDSESTPEQLRAADRLLDTVAGQSMPKTVQNVARQALKRGQFPEDRPS